jgi:hypothetical protein
MFKLLIAIALLVGLTGTAWAAPHVPDGGSSALLLAFSFAGIAFGRKLISRARN